jgi:ankyrin repeat protein
MQDRLELARRASIEPSPEVSVDVNARNEHGLTPLQIAVVQRHRHLLKPLIDGGANPNVYTLEGRKL